MLPREATAREWKLFAVLFTCAQTNSQICLEKLTRQPWSFVESFLKVPSTSLTGPFPAQHHLTHLSRRRMKSCSNKNQMSAIFGYSAAAFGYPMIPPVKHRKLDPKGIPCWHVGYGDVTKGWRLWDPVTRKIIVSRDVTFDESLLISDHCQSQDKHLQVQPRECLLNPYLLTTEILQFTECRSSSSVSPANTADRTSSFLTPSHEPMEVGFDPAFQPNVSDSNSTIQPDVPDSNSSGSQRTLEPPPPELFPQETDDAFRDYYDEAQYNNFHSSTPHDFDDSDLPSLSTVSAEEVQHPSDLPSDLRHSNRAPKYTARYEEFKRSLEGKANKEKRSALNAFKAKHLHSFSAGETFEPQSYKQATNCPEREKWMQAFQEEYDSLIENKHGISLIFRLGANL